MSENVQNRLEEAEQTAQGPGRMLREARKVQQIDQEELSTRLNLDLRIVDAIERDDFDKMPPSTFIKGYLRAYAREVGLDADAVIAEYDRVGVTESPTLKSRHSVQRQADLSDSPMRWVSITIVVLLIVLVGVWFAKDMDGVPGGVEAVTETGSVIESVKEEALVVAEEAPVVTEQLTTSEPEPAVPENSETAEIVATASESEVVLSEPAEQADETTQATAENVAEDATEVAAVEAETAAAGGEVSEEPVTPEATGEDPVTLATESESNPQQSLTAVGEGSEESEQTVVPAVDPEAPLVMRFTADCWTSVQAADGERLVYRVVKAGAVLNIHGEAPFKITLGNSDVVELVYRGEVFDHQPYSRGKIARFVLNADGSAN